MNLLITNGKLITPGGVLDRYSLYIEKDKIKNILSPDAVKNFRIPGLVLLDARNHFVSPGLVDVHIQGYKGLDVWDKDADVLLKMSEKLLLSGTTSFLATSHYDEKVIQSIVSSMQEQTERGAEVLGIHLEGPFINPEKLGMIPRRSVRPYSKKAFGKILKLTGNRLKLMTMAPELPGSTELIRGLKQAGVTASLGHTRADYDQAMKSFDQGIVQVTHLFNAMDPLHHRCPGAITAALLDPRVYVQVIADGIHLHPALLNLILKLKTSERIILITDAVRAAGFKKGTFVNYGLKVELKDGAVRTKNGTLAGSSLSLLEAVRNMMHFTSVPLEDAIKMATAIPARSIGMHGKKGEIAPGKDADLIIFDKNIHLIKVIKNGKVHDVKNG